MCFIKSAYKSSMHFPFRYYIYIYSNVGGIPSLFDDDSSVITCNDLLNLVNVLLSNVKKMKQIMFVNYCRGRGKLIGLFLYDQNQAAREIGGRTSIGGLLLFASKKHGSSFVWVHIQYSTLDHVHASCEISYNYSPFFFLFLLVIFYYFSLQ